MNWFRKLLGLHIHAWGQPEHIVIPPSEIVTGDRTLVRRMGRDFWVRWCPCGQYKHISH